MRLRPSLLARCKAWSARCAVHLRRLRPEDELRLRTQAHHDPQVLTSHGQRVTLKLLAQLLPHLPDFIHTRRAKQHGKLLAP